MKIGFDNDKYLAMQSEHIRERIKKFDNKLYLEFGGKLFDDYHASRVLPGFQPDSKLQKHLQLGIRLKARQHAGRMVVVKQLAAKFQIELIVKLGDTLPDMGGLHRKIFVVIKSDLHQHSPFPVLKPI